MYKEGDVVKLKNGVWGEVADNAGKDSPEIVVYKIYRQGKQWKFSTNETVVRKTSIMKHISHKNYKTSWKLAGFRLLDEDTLVSINNITDLGEIDSSSESDDDDDNGSDLDDFIVPDDEPVKQIDQDDSCSDDDGLTPGQNRLQNKIKQLEKQYS
jgi:hypothetical protein